jgi:hypothetical protein
LQVHAAFSKTELFAVEMNKLMPHVDGFGTYFMKMKQQKN